MYAFLSLAVSASLVVSAAVQPSAYSPSQDASSPISERPIHEGADTQKVLSLADDGGFDSKPVPCCEQGCTTQGQIPSVQAMISTIINQPIPGQQIEVNRSFAIELTTSNLHLSDEMLPTFAPQRVDQATGQTKGHVYVRIERLVESTGLGLLDFIHVARAQRISSAASSGSTRLRVNVRGGVPIAGRHRACSIATGENGWPVVMPEVRRGPVDDCVWFDIIDTKLAKVPA
ncbi:hypothetical protein CP533_2567 [Ophiocordyceps camponoti-saundersi (nom. inval.)]|nr:hypothetical protein CP533_2567 [Ophiocordyceps camponoti-saundersi (nom. inval.)]